MRKRLAPAMLLQKCPLPTSFAWPDTVAADLTNPTKGIAAAVSEVSASVSIREPLFQWGLGNFPLVRYGPLFRRSCSVSACFHLVAHNARQRPEVGRFYKTTYEGLCFFASLVPRTNEATGPLP